MLSSLKSTRWIVRSFCSFFRQLPRDWFGSGQAGHSVPARLPALPAAPASSFPLSAPASSICHWRAADTFISNSINQVDNVRSGRLILLLWVKLLSVQCNLQRSALSHESCSQHAKHQVDLPSQCTPKSITARPRCITRCHSSEQRCRRDARHSSLRLASHVRKEQP